MSEEHQIHAGLRVNREYRGSLIPDHHRKRTRDVHRNQIGQAFSLRIARLLTFQNIDKVDDRENECEHADDVRKARDCEQLEIKEQEEDAAEGDEERNQQGNRLFSLRGRQRIVRLHAERTEGALLENQVDNTAEGTDHTEDEEGHLIARNEGNATDDDRAHGADVREHVDDRERTVSPLIALRIELAEQGVERASRDRAVHIADHAVENEAHHAHIRNRKGEIIHGRRNRAETVGSPVSEDAVRHVGADDAEDGAEGYVEGDELRGLKLGEPQALRRRRIEIIDEDGAEAVACDAAHHVLETDNAYTKGMADETGLVLQFADFLLPSPLLLCRCKRFHTENLLFKVESMPNKTPVKNEPPLLLDARPVLCIIRAVLHKRIISFSIYKYNPGFIYRFLCTIPEI